MTYDYLIIGQGLAGSVLSYQLQKLGRRVAIIDEGVSVTSSRVAAGLANPFTGPKMVKSWKAELLFPYLEPFYRALEAETGASFFEARTLYRPFGSVKELNDWYGRSAEVSYQMFIEQICNPGVHGDYVKDQHGGVEIHAYLLKVAKFLDVMHAFLSEKCSLINQRFEEENLQVFEDRITYRELQAKKVIFCNGYQVCESKYFGWLPMAPVKGEILLMEFEADFQTIYNRSCFIIPQGLGQFKVGSTYDRFDLTNKITESGRNEICGKLDALTPMRYKIIDQQAGIRPGTVARRPLMGVHPDYERVFVFNGMGTKGVSLAPFFSDQFAKWLEGDNYLDAEVDIKKYYSLYFKSQFQIEG
jgi:glycine/D-amino acid oxidase-like deaminating enzyme